ncbi:ABC transporter permease [Georgenia faecalis]|uniref:ABC transporter permease n=1 Tax=Georgenia faecalis TaxID=2483799 RepID=A0ABV9D9F6_9MICO|nr:ABC transporter permease [Georgenia faecalis]
MTTTATRPPLGVNDGSGQPWAATGPLLRFALRLDRVRIAVWALAVGLLTAATIVSLETTYDSPDALAARGRLMSNPATIMMTGPPFAVDDYTFGAMVANELSLWLFLATAIMSILLTVRHTRTEEESGRLEVLRALPVGRFAPAGAAVLTVTAANLVVAAAAGAALVTGGMAAPDSAAFAAGCALTGLVFAAVAAVTAQLTEHARGATGLAMAVLAVAFLVRGIGDVIDHQGSWVSWLSPFAWAQQTRPYVDLRWWPLAVALVAAVALFAAAVLLARHRDLGAGVRPARPGPAAASAGLLSPAGLAWRLLRGAFAAWSVGAFFFAVAFGALANSLEDAFADVPELGEWIAIDLADITTGFAAAIVSFLVVAPLVFTVTGVLRLRAEEESGRTEALLATGSTRPGLLGGWVAVVAAQVAVMTAVIGAGAGLGVWTGTGEARWVGDLTAAALVYLPAVALIGSVALALYGVAPRVAGLVWLLVVGVVLALFLGEMLALPAWVMDLSPLTHTPRLPGGELDAWPLAVMGAGALALTAVGVAGFRRRDVVPG